MIFPSLMALIAVLGLAACGEARVATSDGLCSSDASLGTECGGGIIIDTDYNSTGSILIAADSDEAASTWQVDTAATSNAQDADDGRNNTGIMDGLHDAGTACEDSIVGGYSDWYLPATNELLVVWNNVGLLSGVSAVDYYASTENATTTRADVVDLSTGTSGWSSKTGSNNVRCVRRNTASAFS